MAITVSQNKRIKADNNARGDARQNTKDARQGQTPLPRRANIGEVPAPNMVNNGSRGSGVGPPTSTAAAVDSGVRKHPTAVTDRITNTTPSPSTEVDNNLPGEGKYKTVLFSENLHLFCTLHTAPYKHKSISGAKQGEHWAGTISTTSSTAAEVNTTLTEEISSTIATKSPVASVQQKHHQIQHHIFTGSFPLIPTRVSLEEPNYKYLIFLLPWQSSPWPGQDPFVGGQKRKNPFFRNYDPAQ
ncbi:uncharacterized protein LOC129747464 isoform X2 [Uranotaenia lowii]|uniref:uncharacterized protein LOC129747464 isoform X2 n=1 Tax=Uranotaenia lowii TaxID=190385 RepID=UPI002479DF91|nr:uncharacterized protein LOC129747464 isoform X2 [Uranotaenia lowii]